MACTKTVVGLCGNTCRIYFCSRIQLGLDHFEHHCINNVDKTKYFMAKTDDSLNAFCCAVKFICVLALFIKFSSHNKWTLNFHTLRFRHILRYLHVIFSYIDTLFFAMFFISHCFYERKFLLNFMRIFPLCLYFKKRLAYSVRRRTNSALQFIKLEYFRISSITIEII